MCVCCKWSNEKKEKKSEGYKAPFFPLQHNCYLRVWYDAALSIISSTYISYDLMCFSPIIVPLMHHCQPTHSFTIIIHQILLFSSIVANISSQISHTNFPN